MPSKLATITTNGNVFEMMLGLNFLNPKLKLAHQPAFIVNISNDYYLTPLRGDQELCTNENSFPLKPFRCYRLENGNYFTIGKTLYTFNTEIPEKPLTQLAGINPDIFFEEWKDNSTVSDVKANQTNEIDWDDGLDDTIAKMPDFTTSNKDELTEMKEQNETIGQLRDHFENSKHLKYSIKNDFDEIDIENNNDPQERIVEKKISQQLETETNAFSDYYFSEDEDLLHECHILKKTTQKAGDQEASPKSRNIHETKCQSIRGDHSGLNILKDETLQSSCQEKILNKKRKLQENNSNQADTKVCDDGLDDNMANIEDFTSLPSDELPEIKVQIVTIDELRNGFENSITDIENRISELETKLAYPMKSVSRELTMEEIICHEFKNETEDHMWKNIHRKNNTELNCDKEEQPPEKTNIHKMETQMNISTDYLPYEEIGCKNIYDALTQAENISNVNIYDVPTQLNSDGERFLKRRNIYEMETQMDISSNCTQNIYEVDTQLCSSIYELPTQLICPKTNTHEISTQRVLEVPKTDLYRFESQPLNICELPTQLLSPRPNICNIETEVS